MFDRAIRLSPFYKEHFGKAGFSPSSPPPLSEIGRLPTTDKNTISNDPKSFLCVPQSQIVEVVTTSGSTGSPLVWQLTEGDLNRLGRNEELSFGCVGLDAGDTVILAVALDRCFIAGLAYSLGLRRRGCSVVRVGPATPVMHYDMIRRTGATAIVGVPSFLKRLADKAEEENGFDPAGSSIRKAVCIGEPIRERDLSLNHAGRSVERLWKAQAFSTYGVTELAASLCECGAGRGGHLHPELLHLEALDEQGRPVPDGQIGELAATTFGVEAMPLIRYRTGDHAAIFREPCACGRKTLRIGPIVGRANQKLKLKGTTIFPSTLKTVLDDTPGVAAYAIIARSDNSGAEAIEVKVACEDDSSRVFSELRDRFQGEARVSPQLTAAAADEIENLQMPAGARKRRYFVDLRA